MTDEEEFWTGYRSWNNKLSWVLSNLNSPGEMQSRWIGLDRTPEQSDNFSPVAKTVPRGLKVCLCLPQIIHLFSRSDLVIKEENNLNSSRDTNLSWKYPSMLAIRHDTLTARSHSECWRWRWRLCTESHKRQFLKPYQSLQNIRREGEGLFQVPCECLPILSHILSLFRNSCCSSPKTAQRRKKQVIANCPLNVLSNSVNDVALV